MTKWLLAACLTVAFVPACAGPQKTAMVECPSAGCPSMQPADPLTDELNRRASADLQCPAAQVQFTDIGLFPQLQSGPWQARGCGKETIYRNSSGFIERTSLVFAVAK
jgi:hypothetical protein